MMTTVSTAVYLVMAITVDQPVSQSYGRGMIDTREVSLSRSYTPFEDMEECEKMEPFIYADTYLAMKSRIESGLNLTIHTECKTLGNEEE